MKRAIPALVVLLLLSFFIVTAASRPAYSQSVGSLDSLLEQLRQRAGDEQKINQQRELEFHTDRDAARQRLNAVRVAIRAQEQRQERLLTAYDANEDVLASLEASLHEMQGGLGEMFGAVRQSAGDVHAQFVSSLAMADRPDDLDFVRELADSRSLPSMPELERFWLLLMDEMVGSARVERFSSAVVSPDGSQREEEVLRVGPFTAVADGLYLNHVQGRNQFQELPRQPHSRHLRLAAKLEAAAPGVVTFFALDPSRGAILSHLVQTPTLFERIRQGREIGVIILGLGLLGLTIFLVRFTMLTLIGRRVQRQLHSPQGLVDNPLGRVMLQAQANAQTDPETLEIRLDEAVLRETPRLERGLTTIKILAAVAPLLGLLGTVVGMIETFQSITLFGTGDPQLMAGGISQALVTTALGLCVAIPLVFLHSLAAGRSRSLVMILEEHGSGLLADYIEQKREL